jgi:RNA polymerase sigma factor (sigma-70 family)
MAEKIDQASRVSDGSSKHCGPSGLVLRDSTCAKGVLAGLYRAELPRLLCFFAKNVGRDAAGDLAQEVFVRACASPAFATADNPAGYLQRIAVNLLIDHIRRRQTRGDLWEYREDADGRCEAEQEYGLLGQDLDWVLTRALGELPGRTRQIFRLSRFEQKSYREIREELGISLSAVDYHMMKALSRLKEVLEEER